MQLRARRAAFVQPVSFRTSAFPEFLHLQWDIPDVMLWASTMENAETLPQVSPHHASTMHSHTALLPEPAMLLLSDVDVG